MNYQLKKINSQVYVKKLFGLCWLVYCVSYIGRLNYSAAMPVMIKEHILDARQAGFISMLYFAVYGAGQFINGFLGDKVHPGRMILTGVSMSAAANAAMGAVGSFEGMALIWGINGYVQSMIWAPVIRIFAEMLSEYEKMKCSVNIASSGVVGTLFSYLLSAVLIGIFPWKSVFMAAAVLLFFTAVVFRIGFWDVLAYSNKKPVAPESRESPAARGSVTPPKSRGSGESLGQVSRRQKTESPEKGPGFGTVILKSGILLLLVPVIIHGVLKDGVTAWVPTYISENFGLEPSFAVLLTTVLPIINLSGAYAGWTIYRRTHGNIGKSSAVFFGAAAAALVLLLAFGRVSVMLTVLLLAVITSSMMAVNTLFISVYPLKFEKTGRVSCISGFLNAMAYIGTAVSTFAIGLLVEYRGWQETILTWLAMTVAAAAICFMTMKKLREKEREGT